jgi:phosphate transport system substrate-binding protein
MKRRQLPAYGLILALPWLAACQGPSSVPSEGGPAVGQGRDQIRIVGSSTVYPFSTKVAEQFGRSSGFKTPVIESTGTGGGFKLFCAGVGESYPDVTNASRAVKASEIELCAENGVTEITEVKVGYDGIVVANSKAAPQFNLTRHEVFLALAKEVPGETAGELSPNPYRTWQDINPELPAEEIEVLGPPPTSGTRDAFVELVMEPGCDEIPWVKALAKDDPDRFKAICHGIREDGAYVEAGENDNLIVQKLEANPHALGIFGYSFLDQNLDRIQGSRIDGVEPTFDNIASQAYPVARPLFFYVKAAHAGVIPGVQEFVAEFVSDRSMGEEGYLADAGLIPLPAEELAQVRSDATGFAHNVAP